MAVTGVNHITLVVADLDRARRFYCDLLGAQPRAESARAIYLSLGALWLCLEQRDGGPDPCADDSHIALSCGEADFAAMAEHLSAEAMIWKDNRSEGASVYFSDPDGHKLELHCGDLDSRLAHYRAHPEKGMRVL